jgi:putative flippase GtrA
MKLKTLITKHKTFLLYLVAGGLTTLVDYAVFVLIVFLLEGVDGVAGLLRGGDRQTGLSNVANIGSVLAAVVFAYFINKFMVFQTKCVGFRANFREAAAFFASRALTTIVALAAYPFLVSFLRFPALPSKIAVTVLAVLLNYILSVTVVFRRKKGND